MKKVMMRINKDLNRSLLFLSPLDWNFAWFSMECHFFFFGLSYDINLVCRKWIEIAGRNRKWIMQIPSYHMRELFYYFKKRNF